MPVALVHATTAPSTSRRCSAASGPGPCRSTSTTSTRRPRCGRCCDDGRRRRGDLPAALRPAARRGGRRTGDLVLDRRRRRLRRRALAGQHAVRGGRGRRPRRRPAGAVARRPLPGLHRWHDRLAQGRAVATGRHLRRGHGRRRRRHRRVARRGGGRTAPEVWFAGAAADARGRAVDRLLRPPHPARPSCCTTTPSASTPAPSSRSIERERVTLMSIVGRRLRPTAGRGAATRHLRPRARSCASAPAARITSAQHKEALLELLPDVTIVDGYGASETGGMAFGATTRARSRAGFTPAGGSPGALRGPIAVPRARRRRDRLDRPAWARARSATSTTRQPPRPPSRSSTASASPCPATGPSSCRRHDPHARSRLDGGEHRRREGVRRGGRAGAALPTPMSSTRSWSAGRASASARRSSAWCNWRPARRSTRGQLREHCAASLARFKAPRAFVFVDAIQRHPTGKADYQWARSVLDDAVAVETGKS